MMRYSHSDYSVDEHLAKIGIQFSFGPRIYRTYEMLIRAIEKQQAAKVWWKRAKTMWNVNERKIAKLAHPTEKGMILIFCICGILTKRPPWPYHRLPFIYRVHNFSWAKSGLNENDFLLVTKKKTTKKQINVLSDSTNISQKKKKK